MDTSIRVWVKWCHHVAKHRSGSHRAKKTGAGCLCGHGYFLRRHARNSSKLCISVPLPGSHCLLWSGIIHSPSLMHFPDPDSAVFAGAKTCVRLAQGKRDWCRNVSVVTDISCVVTQEIPRPRLAVARTRATSLRLAQRTKPCAGMVLCRLCARKESDFRPTPYQRVALPLSYARIR